MRDGFPWVFGRAGELEGLGSVECGAQPDFADFFALNLDAVLLEGALWEVGRGGVVVHP